MYFRLLYLSALVSEELPGVVDDLLVCEVGVRLLLTNAQHLPQSDPECPHITGCGELTLRAHRVHRYTLNDCQLCYQRIATDW